MGGAFLFRSFDLIERRSFPKFLSDVNHAFTCGSYSSRMGESMQVLSDADIYQSADLLLEEHGLDASSIAAVRADELLIDGNLDGYRMWKRIIMVIDNVAVVGPPPNELPN